MRTRARSKSVILYGALAGLFTLVLAWWMVFFARQGTILVERMEAEELQLSEAQADSLQAFANESTRMFLYEGAFLGLIGVGGLWLILRSMRREVLLHRQQRDFLSAVTHELRSPIAAARLQVESLQLGRVPEAKVERYLSRTLEDLDRLGRSVNQLLEAARSQSGTIKLSLEALDLGAFIEQSTQKFLEADGREGKLECELQPGVMVRADTDALETIHSNLISNGLKYGGDPPQILVRVREEGSFGVLEVQDSGSGIQSEEANDIFDPFVRGKGDLVQRRPGIGLGLYLVAELSASMGAKISGHNVADGNGFVVSIKLPLVKRRETDQ